MGRKKGKKPSEKPEEGDVEKTSAPATASGTPPAPPVAAMQQLALASQQQPQVVVTAAQQPVNPQQQQRGRGRGLASNAGSEMHPPGFVVTQRQPTPQPSQQHPSGPLVVQQGSVAQPIQQLPPGPQQGQQHQPMMQRPRGPQPGQQQLGQQRPPGPQQEPQQPMMQRPPGPQRGQQQPGQQPPVQQRPPGPQQGPQQPTMQRPPVPQAGQQQPGKQRPGPQQGLQQPMQQRLPGPVQPTQQAVQERPTFTRPVAQGGALRPPTRASAGGQGTLGRPIRLHANHFAITLKSAVVFHYDVDVKPLPSKTLFRKVVGQFLDSDARLKGMFPVFDLKKNIYTARRIPGLDSQIEIKFIFEEKDREPSRTLEFTICLQPTGEVEIDLEALANYCKGGTSVDIPLRPIQALDIAMKYGAAQKKTNVMLGSCLLTKPIGKAADLGGGVEVWFGHFQSLRLGWKPFLNVDATQRAFLKSGKVHVIMADMSRTRVGDTLDHWGYADFSKKIATLKVTYSRGQYIATVGCNGLSKLPANQEKFECDGRMVTVQQYFENKLNVKLQFPHLPCVWVGSREKKNYVPMELCTIAEGQEYRRKLTDFQTSEMIKVAATPADVRRKKILDAVAGMEFQKDQYSQNLGISVDSQMAKVMGRVLPAPKLAYGDKESSSTLPRDGVWNMRNLKFIEAKSMSYFGLINITNRCNDREIEHFIGALTQAGREMGMGMGKLLFSRGCHMRDLEKTMIMAKKNHPELQIIFVIINKKGDPAYEIVKRVGDLDLHITTQCIQHKNVTGRNGPDPSTMANICLKLNAKLGGVNNLISRDFRPRVLLEEQVIIMGADVTHPGADQQDSGKPSIAAVVGSVDPRASQYCCEIRIQKSKQEYIEDMEGMVYNLLRKFNRATGSTSTGKPQRIIFYRDGVSEGQFAQILDRELSAIRKACLRLEVGYNPPVTFIVVQKRHHTRLFPGEQKDECGRGKNVPPGTIVDSTIVHPVEQDFFLVSHQGIQGTSRPTHYHVLWDDSKMQADDIQKLTYYLCYLFTRCTRSVSYPAPCYYSHLVAFRGRQYYDNLVGQRAVSSKELQSHIDSARDMSFMFFV